MDLFYYTNSIHSLHVMRVSLSFIGHSYCDGSGVTAEVTGERSAMSDPFFEVAK